MDGGGAAGFARAGPLSEYAESMVALEEAGIMLIAPVPVSSAAPVRPTIFEAWYRQGSVDTARIHGMYTSLDSATEKNKEEFLMKIAALEEVADLGFFFCVED